MYQNVEFPYSWNLFILTLEGLSLWIPFYCRYLYDWYIYHLFTTFVTCLQPLVNTQSIITLYGLYHWWPLPMFTCQYSLSRPLFHRAINCFVYTCMWLICSLDVVVSAVLPLKITCIKQNTCRSELQYVHFCLWRIAMRRWQSNGIRYTIACWYLLYRLLGC